MGVKGVTFRIISNFAFVNGMLMIGKLIRVVAAGASAVVLVATSLVFGGNRIPDGKVKIWLSKEQAVDAPAPPVNVLPASERAPPPVGDAGIPAIVLDDQQVTAILGKSVHDDGGEDVGRIVDVIVTPAGQVRAAVIDFGGFLGVGSRKIALDWNVLNFAPTGSPGRITTALTPKQVRMAPEYRAAGPIVVLGATDPATGSINVAPEK